VSRGIHTRPHRGASNDWIAPPWIIDVLGPFVLFHPHWITTVWAGRVLAGVDQFGLDADGDGVGCE